METAQIKVMAYKKKPPLPGHNTLVVRDERKKLLRGTTQTSPTACDTPVLPSYASSARSRGNGAGCVRVRCNGRLASVSLNACRQPATAYWGRIVQPVQRAAPGGAGSIHAAPVRSDHRLSAADQRNALSPLHCLSAHPPQGPVLVGCRNISYSILICIRRVKRKIACRPKTCGNLRLAGVADWAWRPKGYRHRTIQCALKRGRPVEIVSEARAGFLATWLRGGHVFPLRV